MPPSPFLLFFFFNDTATTEIYTLSLHDALPILSRLAPIQNILRPLWPARKCRVRSPELDRKSTRLNSSHQIISYAVFCLKKKKAPRRPLDLTRLHSLLGPPEAPLPFTPVCPRRL